MTGGTCPDMRWVSFALFLVATTALGQTPKSFPPAARTEWAPVGCRTPDAGGSPLASRATWRSLHSDEVNTDEVGVAYAPSFVADWVAEPTTWNPTGPVFDDVGNLYFVPLLPYEPVALISLDHVTGARRWSVPATTPAPVGSGTPLVLDDPDHPGEQLIYVGLYDRAFAVRQDGSIVWDVATGLPGGPTGVFGVNYHPGADAIVGLTGNGWIYALDRRTGASVLTAPFQLPGVVSPPGPPLAAPPAIQACAQAELATFANFGSRPISDVVDVLLGNGVEVANYFSVAPNTGRLWVAATAPDDEDGTTDGVSQLGALYGIDLVPAGPLWTVAEMCHRSFVGGSASTPALRRDGSRVYVGDNIGNLIAIDSACSDAWSIPVGGQITGSIGVASDNGEMYASTATTIHQVIDGGTTAAIKWSADLDVFDLGAGQVVFNQNLAGIGANGIAFQAGAGIVAGASRLTLTTGMGILDRLTGKVRHFAGGLDETVAVMSSGPDGALYIGNSPIRRPFAKCLVPDPRAAGRRHPEVEADAPRPAAARRRLRGSRPCPERPQEPEDLPGLGGRRSGAARAARDAEPGRRRDRARRRRHQRHREGPRRPLAGPRRAEAGARQIPQRSVPRHVPLLRPHAVLSVPRSAEAGGAAT